MITFSTLIKLIENYDIFIQSAEQLGYIDLRFFSSAEDEHTLHMVGKYVPIKHNRLLDNQDIEKVLGRILEVPIAFFGEGALGLTELYLERAKNAPLSDMNKTIDYFIDLLIPCSAEEDPSEVNRKIAKAFWESKKQTQAIPARIEEEELQNKFSSLMLFFKNITNITEKGNGKIDIEIDEKDIENLKSKVPECAMQ